MHSVPIVPNISLAKVSIVLVLASAAGVACAPHHTAASDDDATLLAQDGADTSSTESDAETLSMSFIASTSARLTLASQGDLAGGTLRLDDLGDGVKSAYVPAGCVTVTSDTSAHTATYDLKGCSGPHGLLSVTGTVKVSYTSPEPTKLVLDFEASQLKANRATIEWSAHAEITAHLLGKREMSWRAHLDGTTARGRSFTRTNVKTIAWTVGQECVLVNGSSDGNVSGRNLHTDVINYSRCKGECPAAGSEVKITNSDNGRSIDITYDGGRQATFTGPKGGQVQITLACGL